MGTLLTELNCKSERLPCRFCLTAVLRGLQGASISMITGG